MLAKEMCRSHLFSLILTGCVVVLLTIFLPVGWLVVPDANAGPACYPNNEFVYGGMTGSTHADGRAKGVFHESEVEYNQETEYPGGGGVLSLQFNADILGDNTGSGDGSMTGSLQATIMWRNHALGITKFKSDCVAEIQTEDQSGNIGAFEAEFEGAVENFPAPGWGGTRDAVASIKVSEDSDHPGTYVVAFSIELGSTCFEDVFDGGGYEIEFGAIAIKKMRGNSFHIDNQDSGRWGFPNTYNPGNCPGAE